MQKMKVNIYENQSGEYAGITDLRVKRNFDGSAQLVIGYGNSIEETLEDTIKYFNPC